MSPRSGRCRRTPCAARCTGWTTCGSGRATTWSPTPSARKKRRIRRQILALPRRSVVLAQDETDLLLFPPLRAGWSKRGEVARVWLSGRNARRVIFGAMNLRTGARLLVPREKGRSADFQAFAAEVRSAYRGWHVALLLDEDPCHTAQASQPAVEGMTLLWLPKRSPKLNPMDTLWGQAKEVISANKQYATIEEQVDRFLRHLRGLSNREALHTSGVLAKDFWLRDALSKAFCGCA
jgi:DDE superfamily endonuclease